eukprot:PITA_21345
MKLTSWNIRGLNSPGKLKMIKNMIKQEQPQIFFLQETKCNSNTLGNILSRAWPGCHSVVVDASDTIQVLNLNRVHPLWIIGGNFNLITKLEEKRGGCAKLDLGNGHFKEFIQNNLLIDIQLCNGMHTWRNRRAGRHQIASKLDRYLISDNTVHLGGDISASILPFAGSDHWPISLQWQRPGNSIRHPFRFEAFWLTHPTFKDFIKSTWNNFPAPEACYRKDHSKCAENRQRRTQPTPSVTSHASGGGPGHEIAQGRQSPWTGWIHYYFLPHLLGPYKRSVASGGGITYPSLASALPKLNFHSPHTEEENISTPDKFRPITLCNIIYKVISKVIANRLKPLLPLLISPEHAGYIEGRQILDGIILTHEIIHSLKHSK